MKKKILSLILVAAFGGSFYGSYYFNKWMSNTRLNKQNVVIGNSETGSELEDTLSYEDKMLGKKNDVYRSIWNKLYSSDNNNNTSNNNNNSGNNGSNTNTKVDISKLSTAEKSWYYIITKDGRPSEEPQDIKELIKKYNGYYLGNTAGKYIYLTFDEGYENGYTGRILDILKANNVKVAFFVTAPYVRDNKELVKRMLNEGHMVCNHSTTHPSMPTIKDETAFRNELVKCEEAFEAVTGRKISKFFRPPMGNYSELSLYYTQKFGYKSIFWSFAYQDWDVNNQPSLEDAKRIIMERTHGGGIFLLHAVSKTNTEILDWVLKQWTIKGYEFKTINEI